MKGDENVNMANSDTMKITEVIDKEILSIVSNTLSKSLTKYKALMSKFMNTRSTSLYDTFPATRCTYGQQDADELYAVFGKTEKELQDIINKTYYAQIPNFNPRTAKNPVTVLCICIIKYFFTKNDKTNLDLAIIYMSFTGGFYPSIHYGSYKYYTDEKVLKRESLKALHDLPMISIMTFSAKTNINTANQNAIKHIMETLDKFDKVVSTLLGLGCSLTVVK